MDLSYLWTLNSYLYFFPAFAALIAALFWMEALSYGIFAGYFVKKQVWPIQQVCHVGSILCKHHKQTTTLLAATLIWESLQSGYSSTFKVSLFLVTVTIISMHVCRAQLRLAKDRLINRHPKGTTHVLVRLRHRNSRL